MSEENLEIVRLGYERAAEHDIDGVLAFYTEDVEWDMTEMGWLEEGGVYRGKDATRRFIEQWFGAFAEQEFLLEAFEYRDRGNQVLVLARQRVRGEGSGATVEQDYGHLFTLRGDKVCRTQLFSTWAQALEAAGLSE